MFVLLTIRFLSLDKKTIRLLQYWWKQDWTMLCCPYCSQLSTILNNIVTPDSGSTILFNIVDNCEQRGQQNILFNPVEQQARRFLPCTESHIFHPKSIYTLCSAAPCLVCFEAIILVLTLFLHQSDHAVCYRFLHWDNRKLHCDYKFCTAALKSTNHSRICTNILFMSLGTKQ
jgi:hypothetical protein